MNNGLIQNGDLEKEILAHQNISFYLFVQKSLDTLYQYESYLFGGAIVSTLVVLHFVCGIVIGGEKTGVAIASALFSLAATFAILMCIAAIEFKIPKVEITLIAISLALTFISFLLISFITGWMILKVICVVILLICFVIAGFLGLIWVRRRSKTLAKYESDEEFRLQCLQQYLSEFVIPKGQEEISTLNGQLEAQAEAYKNELNLDLQEVQNFINAGVGDIAQAEKLKGIIEQKLANPNSSQEELLVAKQKAQDIQNELVQLNADLLQQIQGRCPRQSLYALSEKYGLDEFVSQSPARNQWDIFADRYREITDRQSVIAENVSEVIGSDRQMKGSRVQFLMEENIT